MVADGRTGIVLAGFFRRRDARAALASYEGRRQRALGGAVGGLAVEEGAHGVVEAQPQNLDAEVDGVAGQVALGPAPIAVFEEEARWVASSKLPASRSRRAAALLQQRHQWDQPGGADLLAGPAGSRAGVALDEGMVTVFSPVGLHEDVVDLFEVHDAGLVAHGFDERAQAEVAGAAQEALAGADDQGQGLGAEGVVAQAGPVQLAPG